MRASTAREWRVLRADAVRCLLENEGCKFIVTNQDYQFPIAGKKLPGNGAFVSAISVGARREPDVVTAKPSPYVLQAVMAAAGTTADRTLMVGDMWSDIAFGHRAGADACLVLSGVAGLHEASAWRGECRPDHILRDVRGLVDSRQVVRSSSAPASVLRRMWRRQPVSMAAVATLGVGAAGALVALACASGDGGKLQRVPRAFGVCPRGVQSGPQTFIPSMRLLETVTALRAVSHLTART